jgi:hypothetical protein
MVMKPSTSFSRGDYRATKVLLVVAAALVSALSLLPGLSAWVTGRALEVVGQDPTGTPPPEVPGAPGVVGRRTGEVVWSVLEPSTGQRLVALVPAVLTAVVVVGAAVVLWRLVATTQQGRPFDLRAVRQLRVLAVLVFVQALVATFAGPVVLLAVLWSVQTPLVSVALDGSGIFPLVVAMLLLVLAESFRVGLRLREDVEGLV